MKINRFLNLSAHEYLLYYTWRLNIDNILPSTRIRWIKVIEWLKKFNIKSYLCPLFSLSKDSVFLFQKTYSLKHRFMAKILQKLWYTIVFDINESVVNTEWNLDNQVLAMVKISDYTIVSSSYYLKLLSKVWNVVLIEEVIEEQAMIKNDFLIWEHFVLWYCWYSYKFREILEIKSVLYEVNSKKNIKILAIMEKPFTEDLWVDIEFLPYNKKNVLSLAKCDAFITHREDIPTNYWHSFTKIWLPMSLWLPVITNSVVHAYRWAPALMYSTNEELENILHDCINWNINLKQKSENWLWYVRDHYSPHKIYWDYYKFFRKLN